MARRSSLMGRETAETKPVQDVPVVSSGSRLFIPRLVLFAGSGCAALIYEIVWFQLLEFVIGSSAISLGLLLAAFMGGLCLGSAAFHRVVPAGTASPNHDPMRIFGFLELGIAVCGVVALFGVPLVGRVYVAGATSGSLGIVLRGVVATTCLLPPTILMGASLPAISRSIETTPQGVSWMGLLYSSNVAGAVVGCLFAGFYLLRVHDMGVATYTAAFINLCVGGGALLASRRGGNRVEASLDTALMSARATPGTAWIYVAIGLSGLAALGAEVVWTRLLSLLLGATVYTFSIILAVFLFGLWAGSAAGSFILRRVTQPRTALAGCQVLLAAAIAWTAFTLASVLPYWPVDPLLSVNPWMNFDLDIARCLRAILPPTLLWGASFPLALASVAPAGGDPARVSGEVYAANTVGSIIGALLFTLAFIPTIGTQGAQQALVWCAALGAVAAILAMGLSTVRLVALGCIAILAWGLSATVSAVPWQVIAYGRRVAPKLRGLDQASLLPEEPLYVGEGMNSSVAITRRGDQRFFYVSGKSEASSAPIDMRLQRMMTHLPALIHPNPRSILIVGFGAGVTAGGFTTYPEVQSIKICELETKIPPASNEYFAKENYQVLNDPRTRVIIDDARHYVLSTAEKFDVITTDPIHPWVKGTAALYTKDYYQEVKNHLNPGGVVAQWLPNYESDEETVKSELATFFSVFPNGTVWSNYLNGDGYDLVLIGREEASPIGVDALQQRLNQPSYSKVLASLSEVGFGSAVEMLATYAGRAQDLAPMLAGAPLTEDLNMRLQYMAGMGLNSRASAQIYSEILAYRKFPDDLFGGSGDRVEQLRTLLGRPHRTF